MKTYICRHRPLALQPYAGESSTTREPPMSLIIQMQRCDIYWPKGSREAADKMSCSRNFTKLSRVKFVAKSMVGNISMTLLNQ